MRDRSLKQLGAFLLVLMLLVYLAQYFVVRDKINKLDEAERKIDFARGTQLASQQLSLQLQLYLDGKTALAPVIAAKLEEQDHLLKTLGDGGRIDGTTHFLKPLPRLPRITYDALIEKWNNYKSSSVLLISGIETSEPAPASVVTQPVDSLSDSTSVAAIDTPPVVTEAIQPDYAKARIRNEGLWLSLSSWYDKLIADLEEEVTRRNQAITTWLIAFIVLNIILLGGVYYLFNRFVLLPIKSLGNQTSDLHHTHDFAKNEIGKVAENITETIVNLKDATDFVTAIGEGNLTIDYQQTLDADYIRGKNKLADSLIDMQGKLKQLNEEERKRQWANEGLAKFVDILRSSNDNIHVLGDKIISSLVQYTHSNQGGLYILNDEDERNKFLELISLFAFDIKKFEQRKIKLGEGILGQTFLEKETTYLLNLPEEYIRITSGLGDASPKTVLIVPLKVDQDVYGLVELASFNEYQPHEIAFVEKLGETIASTLANVRAAQKNRHLIEQFQQQTEMMRAQEEEMRQNMEELQATQEEISRKERSYIARIQELEQTRSTVTAADLETARKEFDQKEQEYQSRIQALEKQLAQKPVQGDDWAAAEELEKALRLNLEALKITQAELNHKA